MSPVRLMCVFLVMISFMQDSWSGSTKFIDPLDVAATNCDFAGKSNLVGIARAGERLVTVGQSGHIFFTDSDDLRWQQASVPVSNDLVAVFFSSENQGWAVGHDGVILHTADAGRSWQQQMSGRQLVDVARQYFAANPAKNAQDTDLRQQSLMQFEEGAPAFTFLDVWFRNDQEGYAIGAFNLIFKTTDGGKNWVPWFDRTHNPHGYHLYSIQGDASGVYVVGELGLVLYLDESTQRFESLESPYKGSFFGILVNDNRLIAYGLRGNAFASADSGRSWQKLKNPTADSLSGGVWLPNGDALLLNQAGELLRVVKDGLDLRELAEGAGVPSNSVVINKKGDVLAVAGPAGVKQLRLN